MWTFENQLKKETMCFPVVLYVLIFLKGIDAAVEEFVQDPSVSDRVCTGSDVLFTEEPISRINCAVLCTNVNCSGFAHRGLDGKCVGCKGGAAGMIQQDTDMKYMYIEQMNAATTTLAATTTSTATTTTSTATTTTSTAAKTTSTATMTSVPTTKSTPSTTPALITSSDGPISTSGPGSTTQSTGMGWGSDCDDVQYPCTGDHLCMAGICVCQPGYSFNFTINTCVDGCVTYGDSFQMYPDHELEGNSYYDESQITLQDCLQMCLDNPLCKSFHFKTRRDKCYLHDRTALDDPFDYEQEKDNDYYNRNC